MKSQDVTNLHLQYTPIDVDLTTSEELVILAQGKRYDNCYFILKFSSEGKLLQKLTIGDDDWPLYGEPIEPRLEISDTGLAYIGFNRFADFGIEVAISVFFIGPYDLDTDLPIPDSNLLTTLIIVGTIGASIAIIAAVIYVKKYK